MTTVHPIHTALFDAYGKLMYGAGDFDSAVRQRPYSRLLFDADVAANWTATACERQWVLPPGSNPLPIAPEVFGDLVAVLDAGERVAILATDEAAIQVAIDELLTMAGGWRA